MTINVVRTLPKSLYVAFSGGVDSVVMVHKALSQNKDITLAFFHHGNDLADKEKDFAIKFAEQYKLNIVFGQSPNIPFTGSKEKHWRDSRYEFFHELNGLVATGHNLDDAVEWYLLTCLRGEGHFMNYAKGNVVRPLLLTSKADIISYAAEHKLEWFEDPSNADVEFTYRNKIRHSILPLCLEINPGLKTTVANNVKRRLDAFK